MAETPGPEVPRRDLDWAGGREVLHRATTGSTQEDLRRWALAGAPHGALVLADHQTRGRGRQQRSWEDPGPGNLFVSVLLHAPEASAPAASFSPVVGLSVAQALEEGGLTGVGLKWPNDVEAGGRKLGGILLEGWGGARPRVLVGLGLDLRRPAAGWGALKGRAVALDELGLPWSREDFLPAWLPRLQRSWETYLRSGLAPFLEEWSRRSTLRGRVVRWRDGGEARTGTAGRLRADGALEVRLSSGPIVAIHAGDVHLESSFPGEEP